MSRGIVLITDAAHEHLRMGLEQMGFTVWDRPDIQREEVLALIDQVQGLVINSKIKADATLLSRASQLKFVARLGSGLEVIDREYARQRGVAVMNSPEGNRNAVAEHALGMLLALFNQLRQADAEVRKGIWQREARRGQELAGKKVGIIGYGHTGRNFRRLLRGWDIEVMAFDKYVRVDQQDGPVIAVDSITAIQEACDVISLHLPLTEETEGMVNGGWLSNCKSGFILINTSRGKIVQTEALIRGLGENKPGGACLDVFENERPETYTEFEQGVYKKLFSYDQIILSPHVAGWTKESKYLIAQTLLDKVNKLTNI